MYEVTIVSPFSYPDKQMAHSFGTLLCAEAWDESADPIDDDLGLPISGGIRRKFLSSLSSRPSYWAINSSAFSEEIFDSLIRSLISSIVSEEAVWAFAEVSKEPEVLTLRLPGLRYRKLGDSSIISIAEDDATDGSREESVDDEELPPPIS